MIGQTTTASLANTAVAVTLRLPTVACDLSRTTFRAMSTADSESSPTAPMLPCLNKALTLQRTGGTPQPRDATFEVKKARPSRRAFFICFQFRTCSRLSDSYPIARLDFPCSCACTLDRASHSSILIPGCFLFLLVHPVRLLDRRVRF